MILCRHTRAHLAGSPLLLCHVSSSCHEHDANALPPMLAGDHHVEHICCTLQMRGQVIVTCFLLQMQ